MESAKTKAFEYAQQHPQIMLITIGVLFVIILVFYLHSRGYLSTKLGFKPGKKGKKDKMSSEEELDDLIESIHEKQKRKKK